VSRKKKITLITTGIVVAIILIIGGTIGGMAWHKSNQANDAKDDYAKSYQKAKDGKTKSIDILKKAGDDASDKGSKGSKGSDVKPGSLLDKAFPDKNDTYGHYNGINRATLQDVRDFMNGDNGTRGQYDRVINNYASGSINIPSINTKLPVIEGTSDQHLLAGATTYRPNQSIAKGNYVLLGHNVGYEGMLFSSLPQVKKGAKITVNSYVDGQLKQQSYKVTEKETVKATEGQVLDNTDNRKLTLITCDVPHETSNRVVVTAEPI